MINYRLFVLQFICSFTFFHLSILFLRLALFWALHQKVLLLENHFSINFVGASCASMHFFSLSKSALFSPHFTSFQSFWGCLIMLCVFALCGQFERFNAFISTLPSEHLTVNSPYGAISPAYLLDSLERHCEIIAFFRSVGKIEIL